MFIPEQQDEHWVIVTLGQFAQALEVIFSFICGAVFMMWLVRAHPAVNHPLTNPMLVIGFTVILNIILVFIHEMGHALAAWSVGRRVHLICVGTVGVIPRTARFVWVGKSAETEYAGFVSTTPVWPDFSKAKSIWVSLGGPLATGVTGILILVFWMRAGPLMPLRFALAGFFIMDMIVNLVPMKWRGGSASDGLRIWLSWIDSLWTPDSWAATRLEIKDRGIDLVSDEEWTDLRTYVRQPFYGGTEFRQLLFVAALEKNDTEMLDILGAEQKRRAVGEPRKIVSKPTS